MKIKSVCGYCGVGCGIEFDETRLIGDVGYPINEGALCAKGVSELQSIQTSSRLLRPYVRTTINDDFKEIDWEIALGILANKIKNTAPNKLAFYLSGQLMSEDYYVANKLAKGFLGCSNVDTNSRTCMASAVVGHKKAYGVDYVPVTSDDVEDANLLMLIGANPAEAHVVFFNKVKKLLKNGLKLVVIDPRKTMTAEHATLFLQIKPGTDIDLLNAIAKRLISDDMMIDHLFLQAHVEGFKTLKAHLAKMASTKLLKRCGVSKEEFETLMALIYENPNFITAWTMGINQSIQGVDKNLAIHNLHLITGKINKKGCGPFSLTGQPNAMGGREVGGLSTMLAVHLGFDEASIASVQDFWGAPLMATTEGLTAMEIFEQAERGEIETLIICHTDPIYHLPNRHRIEKAIQKIPFVVEINAYRDSETSSYAHLRLPASPWGEKEGTQTNMERLITKQEVLTRRSIDALPDWQIFTKLAQRLGFKEAFAYESAKDVFNEYKAMTKLSYKKHLNIYECDYDSLREKPFRWGEKLFETNTFLTPNQKAHLFCVENQKLSEAPTKAFPFVLLTGRTRDQWHSGTKTGFVPSLLKHKPLEFVEISEEDAKAYRIKSDDLIEIASLRGKIVAKAIVTSHIAQGCVFLPVTHRGINYLTNDLYDPLSKEPDYNHACVKITRIALRS
ncbi:molybdopterin oxidoreductase family protein [Sulfurospirillum arsenophilum]|uniref:molybdopterin oxidoreductase family protein n=1 Tax=Sulfurospirillum arsenophilum TaxID=56698 RepID=UPI000693AED1|nr:molybdopterin oxidoreductase family protein [Sulfurospirillum arsenophilum]